MFENEKGKKIYGYVDEKGTIKIGKKPIICARCIKNGGYKSTSKKAKDTYIQMGFTFEYIEDKRVIKCKTCGREMKVLKTPLEYRKAEEELEKRERENLHLYCSGQSWSSGLKYFKLSARVDYEVWNKIKDLFRYQKYNPEDEEFDAVGSIIGWVTTTPYEVEKRLSNMIKPENRLEYRQKKAEEERKKVEEEKRKQKEIYEKIVSAFDEADIPEKATPEGEIFNDPTYEWNIYGGGRRFVVDDKKGEIWLLRNNGSDGADWSLNNVQTGGAGAIGYRVPYSKELYNLIVEFCNS